MKISERTLNILKNFSTINSSILVHPGSRLSTMNIPGKSIFAKANVVEEFPEKFAIFELSKFLGVISLFKEPDFEFFDDHLKLTEGKNSTRYTYAAESTIAAPPNKDIVLPSVDISFDISEKDLQTIQKAVSVLQVSNMSITGDDGTIYLKAVDNKNPNSDQYSMAVGVTDKTFNAIFKSEHLKFMPGDYKVSISNKGYAQFDTTDLTYWLAAEHNSTYGE